MATESGLLKLSKLNDRCFIPTYRDLMGYGLITKAPIVGAFLLSVLLCLPTSGLSASKFTEVLVKKVLDGDTVTLSNGRRVRLLGVNAPEQERDDSPAQAYSLEASLLLKQLVEGKSVNLVPGKVEKDKYGRLLGYLETTEGIDVQEELIQRGYGFVVAFPPDIDRLERYQQAEHRAREGQLGVWHSDQWRPWNTDTADTLAAGFALFTGHINAVRKSNKNILLNLGKSLTLSIRHDDWQRFWHRKPESLIGKEIQARGWASAGKGAFKGRYFLRIRHPMMMQVL